MTINTVQQRIQSFAPVIDHNTQILILGTMPGAESLRLQQYYANKHNHFWRIISKLLNIDPQTPYLERIQKVLENRLGIWDVYSSCFREGSLDSNIKDGIINDFEALLNEYPNIRHIIFNGSKAHDTFKSKVGFKQFNFIHFHKMPSTSPAHTVSFEKKYAEWSIVKEVLHEQTS